MAAHFSPDEEDHAPYRGFQPTQFDTVNLGAPVRLRSPTAPPPTSDFDSPPIKVSTMGVAMGVEAKNAGYPPSPGLAPSPHTPSGQTPMQSTNRPSSYGSGAPMHASLVIADVVLRSLATVSLIVALAVLASDTQTVDGVTGSYSDSTSTKYALAAAILGAVYSIYQTVSAAIRLATGRLMLPGLVSLYISYIGDQIVICLLLTGGGAAAGTFRTVYDYGDCATFNTFCSQGAGAVSMIFVGFAFLAASSVISSFCFYKKRT